MNKKAFPCNNEEWLSRNGYAGMDLRDYFAAKVINQALYHQPKPWEEYNLRNAAKLAYAMADAMMKERHGQ